MDVLDIVLVTALVVIGYVLVMAARTAVGYVLHDWSADEQRLDRGQVETVSVGWTLLVTVAIMMWVFSKVIAP